MARERIPLGREGIDRSAERLDVLIASRASALPPEASGDAFSKIVLYFGDGSNAQFYDVNDTGLADAISDVTGTDTIAIPPAADGTFTSAITIPANTAVQGTGTQTTFISGKVTMSSNSFLRDVTVKITANSGANLTGVAGTGSGSAYMNTVSIQITQSGAGDAYGVEMGAGDLYARSCFLSGTSTGGTGNGVKSGAGDIYIEEGTAVQGSSAAISGTNTFSIDSDKFIHLYDITNTNYNWIFTADAAGLAAAITASATGDIIDCPREIAIALTSGITIPVGVRIQNFNLSFSGFAGNAVTLSNSCSMRDGTVVHDGNGEATAIGIYGSGVSLITLVRTRARAINADTNIGIDISGSSLYAGILLLQCRGRGEDGATSNIGIRMDDYTYAAWSRGGADGAGAANTGIWFVGSSSGEDAPLAHSCWGIATKGTAYGAGVKANQYGRVTSCNFDGATGGVLINAGATLEMANNYYNSITNNGTITYLQGDRGAFSVEDYHAEDIEDSQETRHTPVPVAQGDMIAADSNPYHAILSIGNAHEIMKVNAGGTDPAWEAFDWDEMSGVAGADMVHTHGSNAEGGTLDWDNIWSDAVHDHSAAGEGSAFDAANLTSAAATDGWILTADGASGAAWEVNPAAGPASLLSTRYEPVTNGDAIDPGLLFDNGDVIMTQVLN